MSQAIEGHTETVWDMMRREWVLEKLTRNPMIALNVFVMTFLVVSLYLPWPEGNSLLDTDLAKGSVLMFQAALVLIIMYTRMSLVCFTLATLLYFAHVTLKAEELLIAGEAKGWVLAITVSFYLASVIPLRVWKSVRSGAGQ
jgi:hypothetical protein